MANPSQPVDPITRDRIEALVFKCLDSDEGSLEQRIERQCLEHPELVEAVRHRCTILQELGFPLMDNDDDLPRDFGAYRLLRRLGHGGMGVVYEAEHQEQGRKVALKLLRPGLMDHPRTRERFEREVRAATRLKHPGICPVYDAGEVDNQPFLTMPQIEGPTLADVIATAREPRDPPNNDLESPADSASELAPTTELGVWRLLEIGEQLGRALHYAHEQGLIHRDVKPGNIIIQTDGSPVVLDFGLARSELVEDVTLTLSGDLVGTPAYMSPEQLLAQRVPLDRRTDVYSLGATLYECLTLRRPFYGTSRAELYQQILHSEPPGTAALNELLPREVQTVLATAMEKDRNRRYPTALALAEDLARLLRKQPIRARPVGAVLRLRRWVRRNPAATALVAGLMVGLAVALILMGRLSQSQTELQAAGLAQGFWDNLDTDPGLAALLAVAAVDKAETPRTVATARALLSVPTPLAGFPSDGPRGSTMAVSPDKRFAVWCGPSGQAEVWDLQAGSTTGATRRFSAQSAWGPSQAFAPDSRRLAIAGGMSDPFVRLFDVDGAALGTLGPFPGGVIAVDWHPERDLLAVGTRAYNSASQNTVSLWDLAKNEEVWQSSERPEDPRSVGGWPWHVRFDGAGERLVTAQGMHFLPTGNQQFTDFRVRLWDLQGNCVDGHDKHEANVHTMVVRDGAVLTVGFDQRAVCWRFQRGDEPIVSSHPGEITGGDLSPHGDGYATCCKDNTVRIFDHQGQLQRTFPTTRMPRGLVYQPNGESVLVRLISNQFLQHDLGGNLMRQFGIASITGPGIRSSFLAEDRLLAFEGQEPARIWSVTGSFQRPLTSAETQWTWSGRHGLTATKVRDDEVLVAREAQPLSRIVASGISAAGFAKNGELLALGYEDGRVEVHRAAAEGGLVGEVDPPQGYGLHGFAFSADGQAFVSRNIDGVFNLYSRGPQDRWQHVGRLGRLKGDARWPITRLQLLRNPKEAEWWVCGTSLTHGAWLWRVLGPDPASSAPVPFLRTKQFCQLHDGGAFELDCWNDQRIVLGCTDGTVRVFDIDEAGATKSWIRRLDRTVVHVAFSADGRRVLALDGGNSVTIYDDVGELMALVRHPMGRGFHAAAFAGNGRAVVTVDQNWTVMAWPIEDGEVLSPARALAARLRPAGFTPAEQQRFAPLIK